MTLEGRVEKGTIVLEPPKDDERMSKNPLGIYVDGLDWSREVSNESTGAHP